MESGEVVCLISRDFGLFTLLPLAVPAPLPGFTLRLWKIWCSNALACPPSFDDDWNALIAGADFKTEPSFTYAEPTAKAHFVKLADTHRMSKDLVCRWQAVVQQMPSPWKGSLVSIGIIGVIVCVTCFLVIVWLPCRNLFVRSLMWLSGQQSNIFQGRYIVCSV